MKKRSTSKGFILAFILTVCVSLSQAQVLTPSTATITNDLVRGPRVFSSSKGLGKTTSCDVDTINYTFNKTSAFNGISLNATTSGSVFAQWYPAPQSLDISGFEFFAWQSAGTNAVVSLTCKIYNATFDSLPSGSPLRTVTVNVDSTFGGGFLTALRKRAVFSTPVTTSTPYVITVETSSSVNVTVLANNWSASTPNGRQEWLSSVKIGTTYNRGYNVNVGGLPFDADFIFQPFVSYSLTADFTTSGCNAGGNTVTFTNKSSPVLFDRFYSVRAFQGIPQFSSMWTYGDTSGTWYAVDGSHAYTYRVAHTVTLQDTLYGWLTGCGDQHSITLDASPKAPKVTSNSPLCNGATLNLTADTILGASYYWTGPNGFTSTQQNPSVTGVNVSMIGDYSAVAIMGQCTSLVSTTYVNVISTPSASNNGPVCAGQLLSLDITNITGATYSWTGPNGFTSTSQNPLIAPATPLDSGVYSVSVTLGGCGTIGPYTTTAVVNRIPATPVVTDNGPLCVGDNLNLTASSYAGGTYTWTGPNGFSETQQNPSRSSVLNSYAGTYSVTVTANGCTSAAGSSTVIINNVPTTPTAGNNGPLCSGQSLSLTATAIANATYSWSGPNGFSSAQQNPTRTSLTTADAGNYSVIATVNGCSSSAGTTSVTITTLTPTPTPSTNGPLCPGQNLQLSASTISGATYDWTGPNGFTSTQQNPTINNVSLSDAGIYSVSATTTGCGTSTQGNVNLVINTLPAAPTAGNDGPLCNGQTLNLSASTITGAVYTWSGPNGFTSTQQNPIVTNMNSSKTGEYSVYVTVSGCGVSSTSSTTVVSHAVPSLPTATSNGPVCAGDTLKFNATALGVGPNALYTWTGPNSFNSSLKSPILVNAGSANAGSYNLIVTDSGCASPTASTVVGVKSIPSTPIPSSNSPICAGANLFLYSTTISGATYTWSGPNFSSTAQNPFIKNASADYSGSYSLTSTVNGCASIPASLTVIVNELPETPVASNTGPKCIGDNINLSASNVQGATYSWTGPGGYSSTLQNPTLSNITPAMTGLYSVIAISSTCSSSPAQTVVVVNSYPAAPTLSCFPQTGIVCAGDSIQLFASSSSGATYEWTGPAGFGSTVQNPIIRNVNTANSGVYAATITKGGCTSPSSANLNITVNEAPAAISITGSDNVKTTSTQTYSVSGTPGSIFNWTIVGGTKQSGGNTNTITVLWGVPSNTASVKVQEIGASGCKGALEKLDVTITPNTAVAENAMRAGTVGLYPNPANKKVDLAMEFNTPENVKIELLNMLGQTVMSTSALAIQKDKLGLDISGLHAGVYFVNVTVRDEKKVLRLTVE